MRLAACRFPRFSPAGTLSPASSPLGLCAWVGPRKKKRKADATSRVAPRFFGSICGSWAPGRLGPDGRGPASQDMRGLKTGRAKHSTIVAPGNPRISEGRGSTEAVLDPPNSSQLEPVACSSSSLKSKEMRQEARRRVGLVLACLFLPAVFPARACAQGFFFTSARSMDTDLADHMRRHDLGDAVAGLEKEGVYSLPRLLRMTTSTPWYKGGTFRS